MRNKYPLDVKSVGDDVYILMRIGHHDTHEFLKQLKDNNGISEFMKKVKGDGWTWPMGTPTHHWVKSVPSKEGTRYHFVKEGTQGAWPATYSHEAYGEDMYKHDA